MPNWCSSNYAFTGEKEDLLKFYNAVKLWSSKEYTASMNSDDNTWLGNILAGAINHRFLRENTGLDSVGRRIDCKFEKFLSDNDLSCRGDLCDEPVFDEDGETPWVTFSTETAWVPMGKMWDFVIKELELEGKIQFTYLAEEPGCEVYVIYDPDNLGYFTDDYNVDCYFQNYEDEIPGNEVWGQLKDLLTCSSETLYNVLKRLLNDETKSLNELIKIVNGMEFDNENSYVSINEYQKIDYHIS